VTDFPRLLAALHDRGVRFVIVGGAAATAHGAARLTDDLDIVYERSADNIARLVAALAPLSPYLRGAPSGLPFSFDEPTVHRGLNFTLDTSVGAIDVLGEIAGGGGWEQLLPHAVEMTVFGKPTRVLDLDHLIRVKRAAGRPKDMDAIAELEALREERDR
jgi:predicted nucleotidyltransferase